MSRQDRQRAKQRRAQQTETVIKDLADLATLPTSEDETPVAATVHGSSELTMHGELDEPMTKEESPSSGDYPWDTCIADNLKRYGSQAKAEKVCGAIRARYGKSVVSVPENVYKEIESELGFTALMAPPPAPVTVKAPPATFLSNEEPTSFETPTPLAPSIDDTPQLKAANARNAQLKEGMQTLASLLLKRGNRHNSGDWSNVQGIHDQARKLGAKCQCDDLPTNEINKAGAQEGHKFFGNQYTSQPTQTGAKRTALRHHLRGIKKGEHVTAQVQGGSLSGHVTRHGTGGALHIQSPKTGRNYIIHPDDPRILAVHRSATKDKPTLLDKLRSLFAPKPPPPFTLTKDSRTHQLRFVAIASNNFRDDDTPRQIITDAAHREFETYLKATPARMPELWLWHNPLASLGRCDGMAYVNGFDVYTGLIDKGKEPAAQALVRRKDVGMSHGMHSAIVDMAQQHITQYRTFEISPLLAARAANQWNAFGITAKEVSDMAGFDPEKRKFFEEILGKDVTDSIEKGTADAQAILSKIVESKEKKPLVAKAAGDAPMLDTAAATADGETADDAAQEADDIQMLSDKLDALIEAVSALAQKSKETDAAVVTLQKSSDEKMADLLTPKKGTVIKAFSPTRAAETKVKEGEQLKQPSPDAQWFYKEVVQPVLQK